MPHLDQNDEPVVLLKWDLYRRSFRWRPSDGWGGQIMEYPEIDAGPLRARLLMIPPGQGSAQQSEDVDQVFVGVEGDAEFKLDGEPALVGPLDILSVPASTSAQFVNVGLINALVLAIRSTETSSGGSSAKDTQRDSSKHLVWSSYRRDFKWGLPFADRWGYHRGSGPHIRTATMSGHMVRQPPGQTSPWHASTRNLLFLQIKGTVEFNAAGKIWRLEPLDLYMMRAKTPYAYSNIGLEEALFFDIGGKTIPGKGSTYYTGDPGWPVRADAEILKTELDPHGSSRLKA